MVPDELREFHGRVMSRLMSDLAALISTEDLTPAQLSTLFRLRRAELTAGDIGAVLGLSAPTVTHLVNRLERRGLVERLRSDTDARRRPVVLTEAGGRFLDSFDAALLNSLDGLLADVPRAAVDHLASAMRIVLADIGDGNEH